MAVAVPASVQPGDTVLVFVSVDDPASTIGVSTTGPTLPGQASLTDGPVTVFALYQFAAAAGDAGAVLSFSASVPPLVGILLAYSGAGLLQPADILPFTEPAALTITAPSFTPAAAGSWGLALAGTNSGGPPSYAPGTLRGIDSFSVTAAYDSNGPESPVGGGTWTNGTSDAWWGYTLALRPAAAAAAADDAGGIGIRPGRLFPAPGRRRRRGRFA
jgi:hypothetical protein